MSTHRAAYRQLGDQAVARQIAATEKKLNQTPRYMIPESAIEDIAKNIRNCDIIGVTTNLKGLDVAHTGIAVWSNGRLHLMHAPLVGDSVEITSNPLAGRIIASEKQDGIMVARAAEPKYKKE